MHQPKGTAFGYIRWWSVSSRKHLLHIPERQMVGRETLLHHLLHTHTHTQTVFSTPLSFHREEMLHRVQCSIPHVLLSWTFYSPCSLWLTLHHRGFGVFCCTIIPSVSPREISDIPSTLLSFFFIPGNIPPADTLYRPSDTSSGQRQEQ